MKMGFLLKNNAEKRMGEKEATQKGRERSAQKGGGKGGRKGLQNSRILKQMAGWAEIRKF